MNAIGKRIYSVKIIIKLSFYWDTKWYSSQIIMFKFNSISSEKYENRNIVQYHILITKNSINLI
jgi:uncharacterized membrane protein